mgnify:CR=1 FL=1
MNDIIELKSRGEEHNFLKKMKKADGEESKTYVLKTTNFQMRAGEVEGNHKFIDPAGGPMIVEGYLLEEANAVVKSIDHVLGYGWTITFE